MVSVEYEVVYTMHGAEGINDLAKKGFRITRVMGANQDYVLMERRETGQEKPSSWANNQFLVDSMSARIEKDGKLIEAQMELLKEIARLKIPKEYIERIENLHHWGG